MKSSNPFDDLISNFLSIFQIKIPQEVKPEVTSETKQIVIKDAVLLFGATGKLGIELVREYSRTYPEKQIVVVGRNSSKLNELWTTAFNKSDNVIVKQGEVDVSNSNTFTAELFDGVSQVISTIGPSFADFTKDNVSEAVDFIGNTNIIKAAKKHLKNNYSIDKSEKTQVSFSKDDSSYNLDEWILLNDVIMGGKSSSQWTTYPDNDYSRWEGNIITEGGGFAGTINNKTSYDIQGYDGIKLRIRGDGKRYKLRLQQVNEGKGIYQASFDTLSNAWMDIEIPFSSFVQVKRDRVNYKSPSLIDLNENTNIFLGLLLSKYEYNNFKNPYFEPGSFQIDVSSISFYRSDRPKIIMISSAGAERINRLDPSEVLNDPMAIVKLNPKGILNWKYKAESVLRESGIPYTVIRSTGLVPTVLLPKEEQDVSSVELHQGDTVSGRITRYELAKNVIKILSSPYASGKTFEIRRQEIVTDPVTPSSPIAGSIGVTSIDTLLRRLVADKDRPLAPGLLRFPYPNEPLPPLSEEVAKSILNADPRVAAAQQRELQANQEVAEELRVVK